MGSKLTSRRELIKWREDVNNYFWLKTMDSIVLNLDKVGLTDEQFYRLCTTNQDWQFERNARGELIIMPPVGGVSGIKNTEIIYQLQAWNKQKKLGVVFDSSTMFQLPSGAFRSPDAAWIMLSRWNSLSKSAICRVGLI